MHTANCVDRCLRVGCVPCCPLQRLSDVMHLDMVVGKTAKEIAEVDA